MRERCKRHTAYMFYTCLLFTVEFDVLVQAPFSDARRGAPCPRGCQIELVPHPGRAGGTERYSSARTDSDGLVRLAALCGQRPKTCRNGAVSSVRRVPRRVAISSTAERGVWGVERYPVRSSDSQTERRGAWRSA